MYKIVSFRYESVIQKNCARLRCAKFFLPPQSQIRSYGLAEYLNRYRFGFTLFPMMWTVKNGFDADPFYQDRKAVR